jgi:hypothetical protein
MGVLCYTPLWHPGKVRTLGWPYPFRARPWPELADRFHDLVARHADFRHLADIVDSVWASDAVALLAGCTSMHDLLVVAEPVPDPPYDVIAVRSPSSKIFVRPRQVLIEHVAVTGRNDRIERPTTEAVPLFWLFVAEKFGIRATRPAGNPP